MNALQKHWDTYRTKCYRFGMAPEQEKQIHRAFFAGAFVGLTEVVSLGDKSEQEGVKALDALLAEATTVIESIMETNRKRN